MDSSPSSENIITTNESTEVLYSPDCATSPAHVDAVRGLIDFPAGTEQERRAAATSPTPRVCNVAEEIDLSCLRALQEKVVFRIQSCMCLQNWTHSDGARPIPQEVLFPWT